MSELRLGSGTANVLGCEKEMLIGNGDVPTLIQIPGVEIQSQDIKAIITSHMSQ